ncbi:uncharacterized protein LOC119675210 [Teleopsis dalmanni]|uniref:uncharacterized protein LOC119675210 n=1 Tax=Teleopsis dalmanni TaxID=139649 RepID=UPI0018CD34B2|nr:uncharacterized protein LOC119675210 [Teleopsis dalmanni]
MAVNAEQTVNPQVDSTEMNMRHNVKVPNFNKTNPSVWFAQLERVFRLNNIREDTDKFDWVAVNLDEDIVMVAEDLITNPPTNNKYETLKARLLGKFAESAESKLRRLLQGGDTTGMKPSEILSNMRRLAPDPNSEQIIRTLFLSEMPKSIRPVLAIWEEDDLNKLAKLADKMLEASTTNAMYMCEVSPQAKQATTTVCSTAHNDLYTAVQQLTGQAKKLQVEVSQLRKPITSRNASRSRSPKSVSDVNCQQRIMANCVTITPSLGTVPPSASQAAHDGHL